MKITNFSGGGINFAGGFSGGVLEVSGIVVNTAPVANPQNVSVLEDGYIAITLTATDPESQPLTYAVLSGPSNGVLTGTAPNLTYTPTPNYFGPDSFTFQADDGTNLSNIATVSITVVNVNDAPVADPQSLSLLEDGYLDIVLTGSDIDGNPLTYAVTSGPSNGAITGTAPNIRYTPTANYFGSDSFTFTVNDGYVDSSPATVSLTIVNVNDAPVANPQSVTVNQDGYLAITLTGSDIDGDPLTYSVTSGPTNGVLTGTAPNLTYTPTIGYTGADSFTFIVNDGYVNSAPATVSITVQVAIPAATLSADWISSSTIPSQLTFTRAGTATYIDSDGLIKTAASNVPRFNHDGYTLVREGLLIERQQANNALNSGNLSSWTPIQLTAESNTLDTTAPDGYNTATKYLETAATGEHRISTSVSFANWTASQSYTASIFAKAAGRDNIVIRGIGHTTQSTRYLSVQFNLATGVATPYQGAIDAGQLMAYSMQRMLNGWWRCTISWRGLSATGMDTTPDTFRICVSDGSAPTSFGVPSYAGDTSKGVYLWGAQIEASNAAKPTSYIPTTTTAVTRALDNLRVATTTGWYNEPAWTVIHDAKRNPYVTSDPLNNWRHGNTELEAANLDLIYARDMGTLFGLTARTVDSGFWSFDCQQTIPSWGVPSTIDSAGATAYSPQLNQFVQANGSHQFGTRPARVNTSTGPDGGELAMTWTQRTIATNVNGSSEMIWVPELAMYVSVVDNGTNRAMTSTDGINWSVSPINNAVAWRGLTWSKQLGLLVAVGGTGGITTSPDGYTWTTRTSPSSVWYGVEWAPELNLFVAVGANAIATSSDGIVWTARTSPANQNWLSVAWSAELSTFVAVSDNGTLRKMVSSDGINWSLRGGLTTPTGNTDAFYGYRKVVWSREFGSFFAISNRGIDNNLPGCTWTLPTYNTRRLARRRSARGVNGDKWVTGSTPINGFLNSGTTDITVARIFYYNVSFSQAQLDAILNQFYNP